MLNAFQNSVMVQKWTKMTTNLFDYRISELSSRLLKSGNSDVTELSDPNRPMKLAEELNGCYDNEWTDAYEALTEEKNKKDEEAIDMLYAMLQVITVFDLFSALCTKLFQSGGKFLK